MQTECTVGFCKERERRTMFAFHNKRYLISWLRWERMHLHMGDIRLVVFQRVTMLVVQSVLSFAFSHRRCPRYKQGDAEKQCCQKQGICRRSPLHVSCNPMWCKRDDGWAFVSNSLRLAALLGSINLSVFRSPSLMAPAQYPCGEKIESGRGDLARSVLPSCVSFHLRQALSSFSFSLSRPRNPQTSQSFCKSRTKMTCHSHVCPLETELSVQNARYNPMILKFVWRKKKSWTIGRGEKIAPSIKRKIMILSKGRKRGEG